MPFRYFLFIFFLAERKDEKIVGTHRDSEGIILLTCFTIDNIIGIVVIIILRNMSAIVVVVVIFLHHVHVAKQTRDGNVSDRFLEEQHFNCG